MCRLVAARSWSPRGSQVLGSLALLVAEAARGDPYLGAVTGGEDRHCHGYGLLLAYRGVGEASWRIVYERFDALSGGVDEEEACRANLEATLGAAERLRGILASAEEAVLVFHARRAGRAEPRGSVNTHPYRVEASLPKGAAELYLAHNGGLRKDLLAAELGLRLESYTDSHLLALYVAERMRRGAEPWQALLEGYRFARSGYDVALAVLRPRGVAGFEASLLVAAGYVPGLDEARRRYYEPVLFSSGDAAGYISSTVRDLAAQRGLRLEAETPRHGVYEIPARGGAPRLLEAF